MACRDSMLIEEQEKNDILIKVRKTLPCDDVQPLIYI